MIARPSKLKPPKLPKSYYRSLMAGLEAAMLVSDFFAPDQKKALAWFTIPNPLFGEISPLELIALGRGERLLKYVKAMLAENVMPTP